jgi:hypothetical protein
VKILDKNDLICVQTKKLLILQSPIKTPTNGMNRAVNNSAHQPERCKSVTDWTRNGYYDDDHAYSDIGTSDGIEIACVIL